MPLFEVELIVTPRPGVRDPQGEAVEEALRNLGHGGVDVACVGRVLRMRLAAASVAAAQQTVRGLCEEILVNPSLETYELRIAPAAAAAEVA